MMIIFQRRNYFHPLYNFKNLTAIDEIELLGFQCVIRFGLANGTTEVLKLSLN